MQIIESHLEGLKTRNIFDRTRAAAIDGDRKNAADYDIHLIYHTKRFVVRTRDGFIIELQVLNGFFLLTLHGLVSSKDGVTRQKQ